MAEIATKPHEMAVPFRPPVPGANGAGPWADSLPLVGAAAEQAALPAPPVPPPHVPAPPVPQPVGQASSLAQGQARTLVLRDDEDDEGPLAAWFYDLSSDLPHWLASMVFHMVLLLLLSLWLGDPMVPPQNLAASSEEELFIPKSDDQVMRYELPDAITVQPPPEPSKPDPKTDEAGVGIAADATADPLSPGLVVTDRPGDVHAVTSDPDGAGGGPTSYALGAIGLGAPGPGEGPKRDLLATYNVPTGEALSGRGAGVRGDLVAAAGGSPASERAVTGALRWLAEHQLPDGSWSFNHAEAPMCQGKCRNAGSMSEARNAATGLALLPFLGAGQTHQAGLYQETVRRGLDYLLENMQAGRAVGKARRAKQLSPELKGIHGGSFWEHGGRMYAHGLASIALCEAYAMTHDQDLRDAAQDALDFIAFAQDKKGGGWRYVPGERGDTSMVGWQVMALKSGHMADLKIPPETTKKAMQYLDGVQMNGGANYGYIEPGGGTDATTAIGLLCRMHLGWTKDNPALARGVEWLSDRGPSRENMYYNYYATQVMRHWQGEKWRKWNLAMRDQLIESQAKEGHESGSWFMPGNDHGAAGGGRLYFTALAAMVLEVYYRYLPLYQGRSIADQFE